MINSIIEKIQPHIDANSFFTIPGEEITDCFLVDKEGKGIDCNIYHPKYGNRYEASFFKSVHYEDPATNKKITCLNYLQVLCKHDDNTFFNKDGIQVFKKPVKFHTVKTAETQEDFRSIFDREKMKSKIKDESFFTDYLLELITEKEKEYKEKVNYKERDAQTLELFYEFKKWLHEKSLQMIEQNKADKDKLIKDRCQRYPDCDCYHDYEAPALSIDPANAELFLMIMREIRAFMESVDWIRFPALEDKVKAKSELLPQCLHGLFFTKVLWLAEELLWKMPEKTDLVRLARSFKAAISSSYEISYYTNGKNIPNQELVSETIEYFKKGAGSRVFKPLELLNLLNKQYHFVLENSKESTRVVESLKFLPLNDLEKHVLFGLILKWFGGYPVNNLDEDCDRTLKEIQKLFLSYEEETPEKTFCKVDVEKSKLFMKLGIALTTSINNGLDANEVLQAMEPSQIKMKQYLSFDDLFQDAVSNDAVGNISDQKTFLIERSRYNFEFNVWLQELKGWEYGNEEQYLKFLNKSVFLEFLRYEKDEETKRELDKEKEKASWSIKVKTESSSSRPIVKKPLLDQKILPTVFDILKGYFTNEDQVLLRTLLEFGGGGKRHLIFLGNGNRLTDTLKKLFESGFITGCLKQDLENWVINHFKYQPNSQIKSFTPDYVQKGISRKGWPCKDPIIEIVNGEIQRASLVAKKKR